MARTYVSETKFEVRDKEICVRRDSTGHYRVEVQAKGGWKIVKANLRARKAAWFILRCSQRRTKKDLQGPIIRGKIKNLLLDGNMKMNGVEWIMMSMIHGVRPIILKAPGLFRQRLVYIEPIGQEGRFTIRVIDPLTDHRTEPVEVGQDVVDQAIKTFGAPVQISEEELHGR